MKRTVSIRGGKKSSAASLLGLSANAIGFVNNHRRSINGTRGGRSGLNNPVIDSKRINAI